MPSYDEARDAHAPVEPCELPVDMQLVYVDDRNRRRTVALEDAAGLDRSGAASIPSNLCTVSADDVTAIATLVLAVARDDRRRDDKKRAEDRDRDEVT
jgi:hypothetical protein